MHPCKFGGFDKVKLRTNEGQVMEVAYLAFSKLSSSGITGH